MVMMSYRSDTEMKSNASTVLVTPMICPVLQVRSVMKAVVMMSVPIQTREMKLNALTEPVTPVFLVLR